MLCELRIHSLVCVYSMLVACHNNYYQENSNATDHYRLVANTTGVGLVNYESLDSVCGHDVDSQQYYLYYAELG